MIHHFPLLFGEGENGLVALYGGHHIVRIDDVGIVIIGVVEDLLRVEPIVITDGSAAQNGADEGARYIAASAGAAAAEEAAEQAAQNVGRGGRARGAAEVAEEGAQRRGGAARCDLAAGGKARKALYAGGILGSTPMALYRLTALLTLEKLV